MISPEVIFTGKILDHDVFAKVKRLKQKRYNNEAVTNANTDIMTKVVSSVCILCNIFTANLFLLIRKS